MIRLFQITQTFFEVVQICDVKSICEVKYTACFIANSIGLDY